MALSRYILAPVFGRKIFRAEVKWQEEVHFLLREKNEVLKAFVGCDGLTPRLQKKMLLVTAKM